MSSLATTVNLFQLFGEQTRVRLMALLSQAELTVAELVAITELGQSSVSTHLGRLREAGVLRDRKVGPSTFYALAEGGMPEEARKVWQVVADGVRDSVLDADRERCEAVLRAREKAAGWPDAVAGQMERHYSPGRTWEAMARGLLGLMRLGDVLDVGSGDGTLAELLAPRAKSVTLVDRSETMIEAARARLAKTKNVRGLVADAHELPLKASTFDQVLLFNVLTFAHTPEQVLAEAARVLRRDGGVAIVTLDAHDHGPVAATYGHVQPGFSPPQLRKMLARAGFTVEHCEIVCREKRPPHFRVMTAFARKGAST
jgi:ArsR family transcriptional regulator